MMDYTLLITSAHIRSPKYVETVKATCAPLLRCQELALQLKQSFKLDTAYGAQLDRIGERVGYGRNVQLQLNEKFFELNGTDEDLGWQKGIWKNKYDSDYVSSKLSDDDYRIMLGAKIAANQWDGTLDGIYDTWQKVFPPDQSTLVVYDNQDMTITVALVGVQISAVIEQLVAEALLPIKPSGVRVNFIMADDFGKIFAWNIQSANYAGWNEGHWSHLI